MRKLLPLLGWAIALLSSAILNQAQAQQNLPMPIFAYDMTNTPNGTFTDISTASGVVALGAGMADETDLKNQFFVATSESDAKPTVMLSSSSSTTLNMPAFPLGFTFNFNGTPVDHFIVSAIGGVLFCNTASHMASNIFAYNAAAGNQSVLNLPYLSSTSGGDPSSQVPAGRIIKYNNKAPAYYLISGTEGNHILTVQHNYYTKSSGYDEWLFQYKFYEATGEIEWIIGKIEVEGAYLSTSNPTRYPKRHRIGMCITSAGVKPNPDYYGTAYLNIPAIAADNIYKRSTVQANSTIVPIYGWDSVAMGTMPTTGMFIEAGKPEEGRTLRFSPPAPCAESNNTGALTKDDYVYKDPELGWANGSYTTTIKYNMAGDGTNFGPLDEYIAKGTIVAVLSASEEPDYTLSNGTIVYAGDVLGEGTDGVKPTVLCNKAAAITPTAANNTFKWKANTASAKTNEISLTVDGITAGVTRYIHLYRMSYLCSGGPVYSPLCHTIVLQKPMEAPQSLEIVGLPTVNSVQLKAKAADGLKVMVVKSSTLNVKPSGVLNVGDNIGSDAKVVALFDGEQTFTAALTPDERCYFLAFSVDTDNPDKYVYKTFDVKNENLWIRARAAYNGLPGVLSMSQEPHGSPNTAYNGFNIKDKNWATMEPSLYRDLPFGWTRDIALADGKKVEGFGLGRPGYANNLAPALYARFTYNQTSQADAITAPILVDKGRILVTYEMQLWTPDASGLCEAVTAAPNDKFTLQYAVGNSSTWTQLATWTGSSLPTVGKNDIYKLEAEINNNDLVGQYVRFRILVNGASSGGNRANASTFVSIIALDIKENKTCKTPESIRQIVTQTTTTQIGLQWVDGNTTDNAASYYIVAYKRAGATGDWAETTVTNPNVYEKPTTKLTGLRNTTSYLVQIKAVCGTEESYVSDTATLSTAWTFPYDEPMAQLDTLLMIQGSRATIHYYSPFAFSNNYPAITPSDGGVSTATGSLPTTGNASLTYSTGDGSDSKVFSHANIYNVWSNVKKADGFRTNKNAVGVNHEATQAWLVTPVIYTVNLEEGEPLVVRFKARSANGPKGQQVAGSVGSAYNTTTLKVLVSNTGDFANANVIGTVNVGSETINGNEYEFELPTQVTGTVQVAFYYNNPKGTDADGNTNYMTFEIYDVRYEYKNEVAVCPPLEGLERTFLTPTGATFEWAPSEYAAYYEVTYGPKGGEESEYVTSEKLTEPTYTITGLDEQTTYTIKVTGYCDEEGENAAPDPLEAEFTTPEGCHTPTTFRVKDIEPYGATFTSAQTQSILIEREVRIVSSDNSFSKVFKQTGEELVLTDALLDNMSYTAQTRSICAYGTASRDTSAWSTSIAFATPVDPTTLPDTFNITLLVQPENAGTVTGAGQYLEDEEIEMIAIANTGYRFVEWQNASGNSVGKNAVRKVIAKAGNNPDVKTHDSTFTAVFKAIYEVTVTASPTAGGTVTGAGIYDEGTEVTVTATPKTNYVFTGWQKNGTQVSTNPTYKFTPDADAALTALFRLKEYYALNVTVTPDDEMGSVAASIQPNEDGNYVEGSSVTLTATPAAYCRFVSWQDADDDNKVLSTNASYTVTMNGNKNIKAVFAYIRYTVTLVSNPNTEYGTINGTSGATSTGGTFNAGTTRTLTAVPKPGYVFVKWMSGTQELGTNAQLQFVLTQDTTITAYFAEKDPLVITVNVDPADAGTVTGAGNVKRGENATLTATPAAHYAFVSWKRLDNSTITTNPYTFKPLRDYTFTAQFRELNKYTLLVQQQGSGTVTHSGSVSGANADGIYEEGETVTLTATAAEHYDFTEWQDLDGNTLETEETYTFAINSNVTVKAIFTEIDKYTVAVTRVPNSSAGTVTGAGSYYNGDEVTLTATPARGYKFVEWQKNVAPYEKVTEDNPYVFNISANMALRAVFEALCEIKVTVDPAGAGMVTGAATYEQGDEVTLTATVDDDYVFVAWTDANGDALSTANPYVFTAATSQNITAQFREKEYFDIDVPCIGYAEDDEDDLGTVSIPGDYEGSYKEGETFTMTANPKTYCRFVEWRDNKGNTLSTNPTYTVTISQDTLFQAVFTHIKYTVTLKSDPSTTAGTINGTTGATSTGGTFNAGTTRRLEAKPASGYLFEKWMSGTTALGTNVQLQFVLTQDTTITAYFKEKPELTITVNVNPAEAGTVTGAGTVTRGNDAVLTATANAGYKFLYWERIDGTQHEDNPYTLVKPQRDYTFTAQFRAKEQYTITTVAWLEGKQNSAAGTITREGFLANGKAEEDATITLTANPAEGYQFEAWQDATGKQVGTDATFSFTATANATYRAVFAAIPATEFTVTLLKDPEEGGTVRGDGTYQLDDNVTITATPGRLYMFDGWYDGTTKLTAERTYAFTITGDVTYTAKFIKRATVDVDVTVRLGETVDPTVGTVTGAGEYAIGENVTLTATPSSDEYLFSGWRDINDDDKLIGSANPLTFMVFENLHYAAVFREKFEVTLLVDPDEHAGTVTGAGAYKETATVTITAKANEGYVFVAWLDENGDTVSEERTYSFTMTGNVTYTAKFVTVDEEHRHTIKVNRLPNNEAGTATGAGRYLHGAQDTLRATAATNYLFVAWLRPNAEDDTQYDTVSKKNPYIFTVDEDVTYTALFRQRARYNIEVDVLPNDNAGIVTGDGEVREGRTVTLEATPNPGYTFVAWVNPALTAPRDTVSRTSTYAFTATRNATYKAIFRRTTARYTLTLTASPAAGGTVEGQGVVDGQGVFAANSTVTITATPNEGYLFVGWRTGGRIVSKELTYQFKIEEDVTYTGVFSKVAVQTYNVDVNVLPGVSAGTVTGTGTYEANATATLTAEPNTGYKFVEWQSADGTTLGTDVTYTFTVTSDVVLSAVFEAVIIPKYTVTLYALPDVAAGTVTGEGTYEESTLVTITATANEGYTFVKWQNEQGELVSLDATYTFGITENVTYSALFEETTVPMYAVRLNVLPNADAGTVTGEGRFKEGETVTVTATANEGYRFVKWQDEDGKTVSVNATYTFELTADVTYTAVFEKVETANEQLLKAAFNVGASKGNLYIENINAVMVRDVTVFNTVGRRVANFTPNSSMDLTLPVDVRVSVLVVRIVSEQGAAVYKVYMH